MFWQSHKRILELESKIDSLQTKLIYVEWDHIIIAAKLMTSRSALAKIKQKNSRLRKDRRRLIQLLVENGIDAKANELK